MFNVNSTMKGKNSLKDCSITTKSILIPGVRTETLKGPINLQDHLTTAFSQTSKILKKCVQN